MKTKPTPNKTAQIITLNRQVGELRGQLPCFLESAYKALDKAGTDHLSVSGVMITLTALGGRQIIEPVCIREGLSAATSSALKADIRRSYEMSLYKFD